ncbi:F-box/kelch-repeat protein At3g06240-like [Apium graveolens]|uniref:F-box/kelch-repeat protein At3g06240-like n=1 Tax=Apium graveolens TaxID=4045 RepID=UPI003D7A3A82
MFSSIFLKLLSIQSFGKPRSIAMSSDCTPLFDLLTPDLINDILVRLPVKSLLCCKSVSKSWLSLISDPNFIKSHLKHSITKPGADQVIFATERGTSMSLLRLDSCEIGATLGDISSVHYFETAGSCNGIVCFWFSAFGTGIPCTYLWNPATKQAKMIPPIDYDDVIIVIMGFGFDPLGDDYKVVVLINSFSRDWTIELYSAKTNVWRTVEQNLEDDPNGGLFDACVNGFVCCISYRTESDNMLAFDLNKEVLTCIKLPEGYSPIRITDFNLFKLDDEACLRDSGVEASWTKMLTVDVGHRIESVFGHFSSGDFLLCTAEYGWVLYNSDKNEARNVPVSLDYRRILKYNESLVSITGFEHVNFDAREDVSSSEFQIGSTSSSSMMMPEDTLFDY